MNTIPSIHILLKGLAISRYGARGNQNPTLRIRDAELFSVLDSTGGEVLPALIRVTGTQEVWGYWVDYGMGTLPPTEPNWPMVESLEETPLWERAWVYISSFGREQSYLTRITRTPFEGWALLETQPIDIVVPASTIAYSYQGLNPSRTAR